MIRSTVLLLAALLSSPTVALEMRCGVVRSEGPLQRYQFHISQTDSLTATAVDTLSGEKDPVIFVWKVPATDLTVFDDDSGHFYSAGTALDGVAPVFLIADWSNGRFATASYTLDKLVTREYECRRAD
jgi:hypothetical protein